MRRIGIVVGIWMVWGIVVVLRIVRGQLLSCPGRHALTEFHRFSVLVYLVGLVCFQALTLLDCVIYTFLPTERVGGEAVLHSWPVIGRCLMCRLQ